MVSISVIIHAAIIGFMVFFTAVVAQAVFNALSQNAAGAFLRILFPRMFIFGLILSLMASAAAALAGVVHTALLSLAISTGFAMNAFFVTPVINKHRDGMLKGDDLAAVRFKQFHLVSVAVFVLQLAVSAYIVVAALVKTG